MGSGERKIKETAKNQVKTEGPRGEQTKMKNGMRNPGKSKKSAGEWRGVYEGGKGEEVKTVWGWSPSRGIRKELMLKD